MKLQNKTLYTDDGRPLAVYETPSNGEINVMNMAGLPIANVYPSGRGATISLVAYSRSQQEIPGFDVLLDRWGKKTARMDITGEEALRLLGRALSYTPTEKAHAHN